MIGFALFLHYLIQIYIWIVIIHGFLGFFGRPKSAFFQAIIHFVVILVSPLLNFLRSKIPLVINGLDLTPFALIVALIVIDKAIIHYLSSYAF
ncbi:MAG: YggT family protein [Helicobacter sp.]|nr:YggT family protein [Helicobacter sp.]